MLYSQASTVSTEGGRHLATREWTRVSHALSCFSHVVVITYARLSQHHRAWASEDLGPGVIRVILFLRHSPFSLPLRCRKTQKAENNNVSEILTLTFTLSFPFINPLFMHYDFDLPLRSPCNRLELHL